MNYQQIANEIRFLCADMVQEALSGHPGAAMGLSDIAVILSKHLVLNPHDSSWINRDRLVFSGGHVSALLYAMLHLFGYEVSMQDLREFRKLDSKTPGHPEYAHTHGVEITTGPLGQGIANAVGFAMASKRAQNMLGEDIINHTVYCICGDGDLQEGISYEACSLAGHHRLDNLIIIYDSNNISIEGDISIAFSENVAARFESQGFFVIEIDGHDYKEIDKALQEARRAKAPSLIIARTTIGKYALGLEGSAKTHGAPLGSEVIESSKKALGLSEKFFISEATREYFKANIQKGIEKYNKWQQRLGDKKEILQSLLKKDFSHVEYPIFTHSKGNDKKAYLREESMATRVSNGRILNAISKANAGFIGGSADLAPSNNTTLECEDYPEGRNLHFGVREHAMGAISHAFANYGIFTPFCATFFVFSDYLSPSIRIASLMRSQVFYIFTHDSIGVGEDGATHQPIEQLSHLRAMPNIINWRVADANENILAWQSALTLKRPQSFILTRQNLPLIQSSLMSLENVSKGAYIISESSQNPLISLLASGSEVHLAIKAQSLLESEGIATQVVSMPCFELFLEQGADYAKGLFKDSKVLGIEAARSLELHVFANSVLNMESFGASGKGDLLFKHFGFSVENICNKAKEML